MDVPAGARTAGGTDAVRTDTPTAEPEQPTVTVVLGRTFRREPEQPMALTP